MVNEDKIRQVFEQLDPEGKISHAKVEELINAVRELELNNEENPVRAAGTSEADLKAQLDVETDWRKRARIAAKIISLNLE